MTVWFITGASRGIGREIVQQALARGDRVAATLRRPEQLDDLAAVHGDRLWRAKLDVTDTEQLDHAVAAAFEAHDRIDHVVSNVGSGIFGAPEDLTDEQVAGFNKCPDIGRRPGGDTRPMPGFGGPVFLRRALAVSGRDVWATWPRSSCTGPQLRVWE